jgi:hypothetical protein
VPISARLAPKKPKYNGSISTDADPNACIKCPKVRKPKAAVINFGVVKEIKEIHPVISKFL